MKASTENKKVRIAKIRSFYNAPDTWSWVEDDDGDIREWESVAEAAEVKLDLENGDYVTASGEHGRPGYYILKTADVNWIEFDDPSKFDWDDYDSDESDEDAMSAWMTEQTCRYVRGNGLDGRETKRIVVSDHSNNPGNPLNHLGTLDYATREEACQAIYDAMYDIITGDLGLGYGPERPTPPADCSDEEYCAAFDAYYAACKEMIFRDGSASYDGVSVYVEDIW